MSARLDELNKLQQTLQTRSKEIILSAVKEFFENHPDSEKIVWTQYAPYFNDGDECTFSVNTPELILKKESNLQSDEDEDEDDGYGYGERCAVSAIKYSTNLGYYKDKPAASAQQVKLVQDFDELVGILQSCEDVMKMTFGNHVLVTATKDGFDTEEYEHD